MCSKIDKSDNVGGFRYIQLKQRQPSMKQLLIIIGFFTVLTVKGQEDKTYDFFSEIKIYDISDLWTIKEINYEFEGDTTIIERSEPLGYIGDDYQRFYIHFISAIQNPKNTLEYFIIV